jgi:hypothetical protein
LPFETSKVLQAQVEQKHHHLLENQHLWSSFFLLSIGSNCVQESYKNWICCDDSVLELSLHVRSLRLGFAWSHGR